MDTFRRRSHRTTHEHRADQLAALLRRVLDQYEFALDEHGPCGSCAVDLAIYRAKLAALDPRPT